MTQTLRDKLIISTSNQAKSMFDVIVLLIIGVNCSLNVFFFSYHVEQLPYMKIGLLMMEGLFIVDLILNFF